MNSPDILFNEEILKRGAQIVLETNKLVAKIIGINPAARTTCVKPSGNASVLLMTASGIHGEHAPRYLRKVEMNKEQEVADLIRRTNPYMVEDSVWSAAKTDYAIYFPVVSPEGSIYREDLKGIKLLDRVKFVQQTWIEAGTDVDLCVEKTLRHNVSNTITVPQGGWDKISKYLFENRQFFCGVSFLSDMGDKDFHQAPFTEVLTEKELVKKYGAGAIFAAGLVVDALGVFPNLWNAISIAKKPDNISQEEKDRQGDWIRRFHKFRTTYFDGDERQTDYCLKDVYLLHKWHKIQQNFVPVDFELQLQEKKFTEIDTMGAVACHSGSCEI